MVRSIRFRVEPSRSYRSLSSSKPVVNVNARPQKELVLVGGGHSHVQVLRRFAMEPPKDTHLTLVVNTPVAIYSGMVPGFVAGQYRAEELEIDVVPLARRARARVILSAMTGLDPDMRRIHLDRRPPVRYDVAAFDVGSTVAGLDLPGIREHALPTRPIAELVRKIDALAERVDAPDRDRGKPYRVVVVGGGAGGVELAFTLWERLGVRNDPSIEVSLIHALSDILPGYPKSLIARVHRNAEKRNIRLLPDRKVAEASEDTLVVESGETFPYDELVWVTGAVSHGIFEGSGLATDSRGFISTRKTLQVEGYDDLFAAGDCATMTDYPRTPKAGVYAVRQGPFLTDNLRAAVEGGRLREYEPQSDFLTLLNLGDGTALGAKWGMSFEGEWVMRLKDWIDRRFMRRFQVLDPAGRMTEEFQRLPDMSREMEMLCGGCAAKVGQSVLERALGRLDPQSIDETVKLGLDRPDDAAAYGTPRGDVVVRSLDAFRAFIDDPYLVGRVSAVNAISDLYAKGATPRYALAFVAVPKDADEDEAEELLYQVLAGARTVLDESSVTLLGGHTTTAPELLVGFSVDGFPMSERLLSNDRLEPGQNLVLTKPLGTGVLLHADMQGALSGRTLGSILDTMCATNEKAARLAVELGATAMTDITGFGLLGHLAEMLRASSCSAVVDVTQLPALPGAVSLLERGFRSTFHPENEKAKKGIVVRSEAVLRPEVELLFDPQTSGGLLFGIDPSKLDDTRDRFAAEGLSAYVIGRVEAARDDGAPVEVVASGIEERAVAEASLARGQ
jgi:selenide,water dikinase